jgi:hypothetical protein
MRAEHSPDLTWNQAICVRGYDFFDSPEGERVYKNRL